MVNDEEAQCIRTLATWFEDGETKLHGSEARERMGLGWETFNTLIRKMHHLGAAEIVLGLDEDPVDLFRVSPYAIELARELDARARESSIPPDFVDQIQKRLRRHPVVGLVVVIVVAGAVVVGLLANLLSVLESLGWLRQGE